MNYCDCVEGYAKDELEFGYRDGKIVAIANGNEIVKSDTILCIQVMMEERSRELGMRYISQCSFMDEHFQTIHEEYDFPDGVFNYAGGNDDDAVIKYVTDRYKVPAEVVDISLLY